MSFNTGKDCKALYMLDHMSSEEKVAMNGFYVFTENDYVLESPISLKQLAGTLYGVIHGFGEYLEK